MAKRVLVTSGGTREPIDSVRFITNASTGATGALIADTLARHGVEVTLLHAASAEEPREVAARHPFTTFADLNRLLEERLARDRYDAVIHAAAVSDFSVERPFSGKLASGQPLTLNLVPTFRIVERLKRYSVNPSILVIAFKLTDTSNPQERLEAVLRLSLQDDIDYVVHNDLSEIGNGRHLTRIYRGARLVAEGRSKEELAGNLLAIVEGPACA
jgi:phosphopantothenoylcysteine decarboxylase/phosphopantothenate--cysteine ligase